MLLGMVAIKKYLYGLDVKVVTNHHPLVERYSMPIHKGPSQVEIHCLNMKGYNFQVLHQQESINPDDYNIYNSVKIFLTPEKIRKLLFFMIYFLIAVMNNEKINSLTKFICKQTFVNICKQHIPCPAKT